jgi:hypothetical protein
MQPSEAPQTFVVTIVPETPAPETTVADVLIGSFAVVGLLLIIALCLGVVMGFVRLGWNRLHPAGEDHLPPVTPFTTGSEIPPSSQAQRGS